MLQGRQLSKNVYHLSTFQSLTPRQSLWEARYICDIGPVVTPHWQFTLAGHWPIRAWWEESGVFSKSNVTCSQLVHDGAQMLLIGLPNSQLKFLEFRWISIASLIIRSHKRIQIMLLIPLVPQKLGLWRHGMFTN